ncbi:MAG: DUF1592 domain-containing protein [Myxococcota bacterium]
MGSRVRVRGLALAAFVVGCGGGPRADGTATEGDEDATTLPTFTGPSTTGISSGGADETGGEQEPSCTSLPPRQLRLLTRDEYEASVRDLFVLEPRTTCKSDAHCPAGAQCREGACEVTVVAPSSFSLAAGGERWQSVQLAGSFNAWTPDADDGAWSLSYDAAADRWSGEAPLAPGEYAYKFVIDGTDWIPDPENPQTADDGFGGSNSVLTVVGDVEERPPLAFGLGDELPPESRPPGYPFDNNAASGLVTATHVEAYMRAAHDVARLASDTADAWMPCAPLGDAGCAETFADDVGRRVLRRPLSDAERSRFAEVAADDGAEIAVEAMLVSSAFLYRSEIGTPEGDRFRLTDHEMAAALSYTLVGSTPDDALLADADAGALDAQALEEHARRLLDDPRARVAMGRFAAAWLGVEQIETVDKNEGLYGPIDASLRASMLAETTRLFEHVAFDGSGRFEELLTADYSFVDARLAALYGLDDAGTADTPAALPDTRAGLLGHASVLGSYAYSDQSSPVRRGLFVRRALLCQELPDPPPDAGGVPEVDPNATTRERFDQHSSDPACAGCHVFIDPVGFGFEHFDAVGGYREQDAGKPVDASGTLAGVGGLEEDAPFTGVAELGALLAQSDEAPQCFAHQVYRFTHGRLETEEDACAVEQLGERFAEVDFDILELFVATITAPEFRYRQ